VPGDGGVAQASKILLLVEIKGALCPEGQERGLSEVGRPVKQIDILNMN
jgi:hypothetical protein